MTQTSFLRPLTIGGLTLKHNLILGPMAGVTDLPFRALCAEEGAALTCTELISAKAIVYGNRNTAAMLETHPKERPVAIQIFGHEPEIMAEAIRKMRRMQIPMTTSADDGGEKSKTGNGAMRQGAQYDILDINMGCPVPKVVSNGEGSALMKDPRLIGEIVRACVEAEREDETPHPVTVKLRAGFDAAHVNAVECALAAQEGGASAVTIHARTRDQYYSGQSNWQIITDVKQALSIPVIGNGDVVDGESARRMFAETGCDGVMVARAAQGNPWIFQEILSFLQTGETPVKLDNQQKYQVVLKHMDALEKHKGAWVATREMRKHIAWYITGMKGAARMRDRVNLIDDLDGMREACRKFFLEKD